MHSWYGGFGWIGMILGGIFWLAVLVGLVLLVVWGIKRVSSGSGMTNSSGSSQAVASPKEILQARYARGEITREQYTEMLSDLNK